MARFNSILETIGHTPLVKLQKLAPKGVNVFLKLESFNPMGSVKDRMAIAIIEDAELSGALQAGQTVIEATSGNTGISLAMVCAQKGYPLVVTMAENFSIERRKMLRFLGAKVVLTPAAEKGTGMLNKARELAEKHGYFLCNQFDNEINADIHTRTTAPEIIDDMGEESLDYWVSGFGTGGTLKGTARGLKAHDEKIKIIAAEPDNSQLLGSNEAQARHADGTPDGSHPNFRPHLMQGWAPDFISSLTESAMLENLIDEIVPVAGLDAIELSQRLAKEEGVFVGTSSGATLAAALKVAGRSKAGTNIVCMMPDTGERYLSTPLFEDISVEMNEEEIALSNSTAGCKFQITPAVTAVDSAPVPVAVSIEAADLNSEMMKFVDDAIQSSPVVMFALEWCEFCWSVRKLFKLLDIAYLSVDVDSVAFQEDNKGTKIRRVLQHKTGVPTIPQIFIGGELIGGSTELLDEYASGGMAKRLAGCQLTFNQDVTVDPESLMPSWLHPREVAEG